MDIKCTLSYFPGTFDEYKSEANLYKWIPTFPDKMRGLGYKMDGGKSFSEFRQSCGIELKPAKSGREKRRNILFLLEHAERQIVGNYLFSEWRYLTHWTIEYSKYDVDFLWRIIDILEAKY